MSLTFLHMADCHLGSPLGGLAARDGALARLFDRAVWHAFEAAIDLAVDEKVAFVAIAGDVFDKDWKDYGTGQAFTRTIARLTRAGIRCVMIRGNHDAESVVTRSLPLPEGVCWLSHERPETIDWPDIGVAVHGMSFATAAVTDPIVRDYPPPLPGRFNVGLLHTALDGRPDVARYAPATPADLERLGYDYWALGHVHAREVVRDAAPAIVFPGNIQGRSIRETGEKSVTLVTADGGRVSLRHVPVDRARFALVEVDVTGATDRDGLFARLRRAAADEVTAAGGRPLAVRVRFTGAADADLAAGLLADREALRQDAQAVLSAAAEDARIEKLVVAVSRAGAAPVGLPGVDLDEVLATVSADPAVAAAVAADGAGILARMPPQAQAAAEADDAAIIAAARDLILSRLGSDR